MGFPLEDAGRNRRRPNPAVSIAVVCATLALSACIPVILKEEVPPSPSGFLPADSAVKTGPAVVLPLWFKETGDSLIHGDGSPRKHFLGSPVFIEAAALDDLPKQLRRYSSAGVVWGSGDFSGRRVELKGIYVIASGGDAAWMEPGYEDGRRIWENVALARMCNAWIDSLAADVAKDKVMVERTVGSAHGFWRGAYGQNLRIPYSADTRQRLIAFVRALPRSGQEGCVWASIEATPGGG